MTKKIDAKSLVRMLDGPPKNKVITYEFKGRTFYSHETPPGKPYYKEPES